MDAQTLIDRLGLEPLPEEGGYYRETWRAGGEIPASALPERYGGSRNYGTLIYYLLTPDDCSGLHRVKSDEIFHFYLGDPVTMLHLHPDGSSERVTLGPDILSGELLQCVVPALTWQGAMLERGGRFALMGCTVAPGFEFADFESADRAELMEQYPDRVALIRALTDE